MDKVITLEELAQDGNKIFIDNNIFSRTYNSDELRSSVQKEDYSFCGLAARLGASFRFSDVNIRHLRREARHALNMLKLIERFESIISVPEILDEYKSVIDHMQRAFDYFVKNSVSRNGKKSQLLKEAISNHGEILRIIGGRAVLRQEAEEITRFLYENELYLPYDGKFRKKFRNPEESPADASLVSYAMLEAEKADIVSADTDVINLVRNYSRYKQEGKLPSHFPYRHVSVYFPDSAVWFPRLGLSRAFTC